MNGQSYNEVKQTIENNIVQNKEGKITGQILQDTLIDMLDFSENKQAILNAPADGGILIQEGTSGVLNTILVDFEKVQSKIDDLDEIRSGAEAGATAVRPEELEDVKEDVNAKIIDIPVEKGSGENSIQQKETGATAVGPSAVAEGGDNLEGAEPVTGEEKLYSKAEGYASHAEGAAHAIGRYSHAEGGGNSIEEGHPTRSTAEGAYSHAEGTHTHAIGNGSHAEGHLTIAKSAASHAEGRLTVAGVDTSVGRYAHAEGFSSKATGENSHAEGNATNATGANSHSEGSNNTASGESSHTEGAQTSASANHSHAGGFASEVSSPRGFVHGRNVEAKSNVEGQFAVGKYNKSNTNQILSVGIGTGTPASQRKNAFEIMQNGDAFLYGVGGYDGTNAADSGATTLQETIKSKTTGVGISNIVAISQADYDALEVKDSTTLYVIIG